MSPFTWLGYVIIMALQIGDVHSNTCSWGKLDLSPLSKLQLNCSYSNSHGNFKLEYTPCTNHIGCEQDGGEFMIIQYDTQNDYCVGHTAEWDDGATEPTETIKNDTNGGYLYEYTFNYDNGLKGNGCPNGRATTIKFICDASAIPYNRLTCDEYEQSNGICPYWMEIYTYLACDDRQRDGGDNQSNKISVGSILLIVGLFGFIVYCIIGYMMNGMKTDSFKDWQNNIPHFIFWIKLPLLVKTGCIVSFECITGKYNDRMEQETQLIEQDTDK